MKAARIISDILAILVVAAILVAVVPQLFGVKYFAVLSGSMEPDVPVGSLVVSVPKAPQDIHEGDIVSYVADKSLTVVTHRVVSVDLLEKTITTKGDANESADPDVFIANVIGVSAAQIPYLGYVLSFFTTLSGKIIAITVASVIILSSFFIRAIRHYNKKQVIITYTDKNDLSDATLQEIGEHIRTNDNAR